MHGIYNHIPEINHVSRVYSVTAVLYLQFVLHVMLFCPCSMFLYFYSSTSDSMCAVPNVAVFCNFLILFFPSMLLRYCLNDFEMVPVVSIITGITLVFTYHMCCIFIVMFLSSNLHNFFFMHFCLQELQHLLTCMFLYHYHAL